mmetsp:Transcript_5867/g.15338  ORF Transcript_5867/g.15338 Transcript_5867/m.15338 type:complete len:211 (-) Transcript_5867:950-1582(-)
MFSRTDALRSQARCVHNANPPGTLAANPPAVGGRSAERAESSVDLPDPTPPATTTRCPPAPRGDPSGGAAQCSENELKTGPVLASCAEFKRKLSVAVCGAACPQLSSAAWSERETGVLSLAATRDVPSPPREGEAAPEADAGEGRQRPSTPSPPPKRPPDSELHRKRSSRPMETDASTSAPSEEGRVHNGCFSRLNHERAANARGAPSGG